MKGLFQVPKPSPKKHKGKADFIPQKGRGCFPDEGAIFASVVRVRTDRRLRMSYRPPLEPSPCVLNQSPCRSKTHRHASTMVVSGVFDGGDVRLPTTTVADAVSIL